MGEREGRIERFIEKMFTMGYFQYKFKNTIFLTKIAVDYKKGTFRFDDKKESLRRKNLV